MASTRSVAPSGRVDVIGIGAQKSGTSWVFRMLEEHPEVRGAEGPSNKELNFFNHHYSHGSSWYESRFRFGPWRTVEFSTLYWIEPGVPERIRRYRPDVKLVLAIRNPIDRAYSQHLHEMNQLFIPPTPFWQALERNPTYVEQGLYATNLERWLEVFPRNQIHVVVYDEIRSSPEKALRDLYGFLGVAGAHRPEGFDQPEYASPRFRSPGFQRVVATTWHRAEQALGAKALTALRATRLPRIVKRMNRATGGEPLVPKLTLEDRASLRRLFEDDLSRLPALVGRDVPDWR
jgi:hypothetical protein